MFLGYNVTQLGAELVFLSVSQSFKIFNSQSSLRNSFYVLISK